MFEKGQRIKNMRSGVTGVVISINSQALRIRRDKQFYEKLKGSNSVIVKTWVSLSFNWEAC